MAILAKIRSKTIFLILIIGLALFAFVASGIFKGSGNSGRVSIGSVNGEKISNEEFSKLLEAQKNNKVSSIQAVKNVWNTVVRQKVYKDALEKAGIVIGEKDIWDAMISNSSIQNDQRFKDESGLFDENKLKEYIATLKDNKDTPQGAAAWNAWVNYENNVKTNLAQTTYNNLVKSGLVATLKEGERVYKSENTSSDIESVYVPYSTVKDDEAKVTDAEVTAYENKHAKEFEVEANNEIEFVKFEVKPSAEDIENVKNDIKKLISAHQEWNESSKSEETVSGFDTAKDAKEFVREYSDSPYADKLYLKKDLPNNVFDTLMTKSVGYIYGPYRDGDYFKLAKILSKDGEESVKSSHILIAYKGATGAGGDITRTRDEAEVLAKKVLKGVTIKNFADKAKEYSDGPSASKGGDLGFVKQGQLVKVFNDYIFDKNNSANKIGLVETSYGFHIIKIDEKKSDPGLELAIVTRKIDPSEETESKIYQSAETFALNLTNGKKIEDLAKENKYTIKHAKDIKILDDNINGLGKQREIVKWTFDKTTKKGEIKRFDLDNGDYAVVVLKNKFTKGLMPLNQAKLTIAPILKKEKKASIIRNKISGATLDEMAKSVKMAITKSNDISIANSNIKNLGKDVNVAAALLYMKENDIKVINANNGVIIVKILKKKAPFEIKNFGTYSKTITSKLKSKTSKIFDALKEGSDIEDNRTLFY